jgi:uncharacterized protein YndB with AHSA1/START domain
MLRYRASIVIAAEPQRVFDYLADFGRHPEWAGDDLTVEAVEGGPVGVGSRFRSAGKQMGLQRDETVVTRFEPPWRLEFESTGDEGRFRNGFELTPVAGGTRVSKTFESVQTRGLARVAQAFYPLVGWVTMKRDLVRIRRGLDLSPTPLHGDGEGSS